MAGTVPPTSLLDKIAGKLREPAAFSDGGAASILAVSGAQYGHHQDEDLTQPTGFDPRAAALFEAVVESAYLIATADGDFDADERAAFEHVVLSACNGAVTQAQLRALLADLEDLRAEDGAAKRLTMVARTISRGDQALEVLRVSALIARVSQGVSTVERELLDKLAAELKLEGGAVEAAIAAAERVLSE